jgi:hypothetical protein
MRDARSTRREIPRLATFYRDPNRVANYARFGMTPLFGEPCYDAGDKKSAAPRSELDRRNRRFALNACGSYYFACE